MIIREVHVKNFRSILDELLPCNCLTALVGRNGKVVLSSGIGDVLRLLGQGNAIYTAQQTDYDLFLALLSIAVISECS